jgi:hypothetical protein
VSRIGKLTIFVDQTRHKQNISVRTVGARGPVALNTIKLEIPSDFQSPSPDAATFWHAILSLVLPDIV